MNRLVHSNHTVMLKNVSCEKHCAQILSSIGCPSAYKLQKSVFIIPASPCQQELIGCHMCSFFLLTNFEVKAYHIWLGGQCQKDSHVLYCLHLFIITVWHVLQQQKQVKFEILIYFVHSWNLIGVCVCAEHYHTLYSNGAVHNHTARLDGTTKCKTTHGAR